ncbi:SLOG family protein, partial [Bacillus sp. HC-Mk]
MIIFKYSKFKWLIISGQLGVELWAAEVVFEMQVEYPD